MSERCPAMYEPGARQRDTHTCSLLAGHPGPHCCPLCASSWFVPGGAVTSPHDLGAS